MSPPPRPLASPLEPALSCIALVAALAGCQRTTSSTTTTAAPSTRPSASAPSASTTAPALRCTLSTTPVVVGRRGALGSGLTVARSPSDTATGQPRFSLGWAVVPSEGRCEDTALVELDAEGNVTRTADGEDPLTMCEGTRSIEHLCTGFGREGAAVVTDYDALLPSQRTTRCGALEFSYPRRTPGNGAGTVADATPAAPYDCRTLGGSPARVLAVRPALADGRVTAVELVAARGAEIVSGSPIARLPVDLARLANAPSQRTELHDSHGIDGFDALPTSDGGFVYAFRYRQRLYVGALAPSLSPHGAPSEVSTLGGRPGKPRLALASDTHALLLFADAPAGGRYTLRASLFTPGEAVPTPAALDTDDTNPQHEFAPSASTLADGTWVITWSQGPLEVPRDGTDTQRIRVRHYAPDLRPLELPLFVNAIETGSDARVLTAGDRFLLAAFSGRGSNRQVVTLAGRCQR